MPIYEFFCQDCNIIFNFFSRRINTATVPVCPKCGSELKRLMSVFSTIGKAKETEEDGLPDFDESRMEQAMGELAHEAENVNEDNPRQLARIMRKFSEKTGMHLGEGMEQALCRMEAGEDPERIEQDMGDALGGDDLFGMAKKARGKGRRGSPGRDETLYEL